MTPGAPDGETASAAERPWPASLTRAIGGQVRKYREAKGMKTEQLAEAMSLEGFAYTAAQVVNVESAKSSRRASITLGELLMFAKVLDIAPASLITPVGAEADLEILPATWLDPWEAYTWLVGTHRKLPLAARMEVSLYRDHDDAVRGYIARVSAGRADLEDSVKAIVRARGRLRDKKWRLPKIPPPGYFPATAAEALPTLLAEIELAEREEGLEP